jgi:hypothetical protein
MTDATSCPYEHFKNKIESLIYICVWRDVGIMSLEKLKLKAQYQTD